MHHGGADCRAGLEFLVKIRERALSGRFSLIALPIVNIHIAREKLRSGDVDAAIELSRGVFDGLFDSGPSIWGAMAAAVLVEALLQLAGERDLEDAQAAIDRLETMPTDPGMVLLETILLRLRALLAQARRGDASYRDYRDRYRAMAADFGFEGHMAMAEAMI
jgi:adenylate cyclase